MASGLFKSLLSGKKQKTKGNEKRFGSTRLFALKESRWFKKEESNLFENVLDSGYILELRIASGDNGRNVNKDSAATLEYGIVLWMKKPAGEKRQAVVIHLVEGMDKSGSTSQVVRCSSLESFWCEGTEIRINNMDDREEKPDSASKITERVNRASKGFYKWSDSYSFVHWCRYGNPIPLEETANNNKQMCNAAIRWGGVSASTGALFYFSRHQRQCLK